MAMPILRLLMLTRIPGLVFRLMLDRRVPLRLKLIIPAAVIYLVLPIDLLPDLFPILGHTDDLVVILVALASFLLMTPRSVLNEYLTGRPADSPTEAGGGQPREKVIEGQYRHVEDEDAPKGDSQR